MEETAISTSAEDDDIYVVQPAERRPKTTNKAGNRKSQIVINLTVNDERSDKDHKRHRSKSPAVKKSMKKLSLQNFTLLKVLGKGSFGKVDI